MTGGKIRIRMEAYDHQALDASAKEIVDHAKRTHKRIIDITEPNARTVEALNRLVVPAGVFVKIKA